MLSKLISSRVRREILVLFLTHPEKRYYQTQLARDFKIPMSAVQKELKSFAEIGFLTSEREANILFFQVNKGFPLYEELKSIIYKTIGLADVLKENLSKIGHIEVAFIYGSVAKNTEDVSSDIDLMVIGEPDMNKLSDAVTEAESNLSREINYTVFDLKDWKKRLKEKRGFVVDVKKSKKIFLIGGENELRKIS